MALAPSSIMRASRLIMSAGRSSSPACRYRTHRRPGARPRAHGHEYHVTSSAKFIFHCLSLSNAVHHYPSYARKQRRTWLSMGTEHLCSPLQLRLKHDLPTKDHDMTDREIGTYRDAHLELEHGLRQLEHILE